MNHWTRVYGGEHRWHNGRWRFEMGHLRSLIKFELELGGHSEGVQVGICLSRLGAAWLTYQTTQRQDAWLMRLHLLPCSM